LGAHGSICAIDSAVPNITVKLWQTVQRGDHATALRLHRGINTLWNAMTHENLPACVKFTQSLQGLPLHRVRAPMQAVPHAQQQAIETALATLLG
jgi:4-hydroxy-tetrahydrodipicolinate synthase